MHTTEIQVNFLNLLKKRLSTPELRFDERTQKARLFWRRRAQLYTQSNDGFQDLWSLGQIAASMARRKIPIKLSCRLFIYNSVLLVPFIWTTLSKNPLGTLAAVQHTSWLDFAVVSPPPMLLDHAVHFLQSPESIAAFSSTISWLSAGMFLMLSFRVNRAVSRWWAARNQLGRLDSECRALVTSIQMYVKDAKLAADLGVDVFALIRAIEYQLTRASEPHWAAYFPPMLIQDLRLRASPPPPCCDADALLARPPGDRPFMLVDRVSLRLGRAFDEGKARAAESCWQDATQKWGNALAGD